jgi:hypothetical protein
MPYNVKAKEPDKNGKIVDVLKPYDIKEKLFMIILHPRHGHGGFRQFTVGKVAARIQKCEEDSIVLDSTEYAVVKEALDGIAGYGPDDQELLNRVYEAERVEG